MADQSYPEDIRSDLPLVQHADLEGKIVLVRVDHNVVSKGETLLVRGLSGDGTGKVQKGPERALRIKRSTLRFWWVCQSLDAFSSLILLCKQTPQCWC